MLCVAAGARFRVPGSRAGREYGRGVARRKFRPSSLIARSATASQRKGFNGYYPIPRLAGQQIAYIENELQGFVEHKRTNNIMFNVGHVLSPAMIRALATDFHNLNPKPLGGGPKDLVSAGEKIFQQGLPDAGVPPCASCHGPEAKGNDQFPRLGGPALSLSREPVDQLGQ